MWTLLQQALSSPTHAFSMGSFGAIGEFMRNPDEAFELISDKQMGCMTKRGALMINPIDNVRPVAYEYLSRDPRFWVQGIAFCLPEANAQMDNHAVITDLGLDIHALNADHRAYHLFDIGLNQGFVNVAVRTRDKSLIKVLQRACGTNILADNNSAMAAIIKAGPHRVFSTELGRLEIYQPIGLKETPDGPHSHVLPKLLASGRAFAANIPIPGGFLPVMTLHMANPCRNLQGKEKPFDAKQLQTFHQYLEKFADKDYLTTKQQVFSALKHNTDCKDHPAGKNRLERMAIRIAIRQYHQLYPEQTERIQRWRQRFDHPVETAQINRHEH